MAITTAPKMTRRPTPADSTFRYMCLGAGVLVLIVLGLITYTMTTKSWDAFSHMGLSFFTDKRWDIANQHYGALSYIFGTLYSATIAILLAIPLSLGIALLGSFQQAFTQGPEQFHTRCLWHLAHDTAGSQHHHNN